MFALYIFSWWNAIHIHKRWDEIRAQMKSFKCLRVLCEMIRVDESSILSALIRADISVSMCVCVHHVWIYLWVEIPHVYCVRWWWIYYMRVCGSIGALSCMYVCIEIRTYVHMYATGSHVCTKGKHIHTQVPVAFHISLCVCVLYMYARAVCLKGLLTLIVLTNVVTWLKVLMPIKMAGISSCFFSSFCQITKKTEEKLYLS